MNKHLIGHFARLLALLDVENGQKEGKRRK